MPTRLVISQSMPVSSLTSRTAASRTDSPGSIPPPGIDQYLLSVRWINRMRPWSPGTTTLTAGTMLLAFGAAGSSRQSMRATSDVTFHVERPRLRPDVLEAFDVRVEQRAAINAAQMQDRRPEGRHAVDVRVY